MQTECSVLIKADRQRIFATTTDLSLWPKVLPHYRYIHFLERTPTHDIVKMAARRDFIPISWVSRVHVDAEKYEMHFHHLRAFTKGMDVVWTYEQQAGAVKVSIFHELRFRVPALAPMAEKIIGGFFIDNIAHKTLHTFKKYLEQ